jgi:hypothetical protein
VPLQQNPKAVQAGLLDRTCRANVPSDIAHNHVAV